MQVVNGGTVALHFEKWTALKASSLSGLAGKFLSRTAEYLTYLRIAESNLTH